MKSPKIRVTVTVKESDDYAAATLADVEIGRTVAADLVSDQDGLEDEIGQAASEAVARARSEIKAQANLERVKRENAKLKAVAD